MSGSKRAPTARTLLAITASAALTFWCEATDAAELEIRITVAKPGEGLVSIGVWGSEDDFLRRSVASRNIPVKDGEVVAVIDLPPGRYAVSAYQDLDEDGELDSGLFRIPREPTGFSNDARGVVGPPVFDAAALDLPDHGAVVRFRLR